MFSWVSYRLAATLLLVLTLGQLSGAQEPKLNQLLQRSPMPANAVGYLHLPSLKSLMAKSNFPLQMSENVDEIWFVSELDTASLNPTWEAGYAMMKKPVDVKSLAAVTKGYVDKVGDQEVVCTPRQSYLVPVGENRLGFLRPAKRNLLADWVGSKATHAIPAYLATQANQPESFLSLMLAVDLKDSFSPVNVASRVSSFKGLGNQDPQAVASILASVQGVSVIVGRHSLAECILAVEFGQSPASLAPIANDILSEILNRNGTQAQEVATWKVKVEGNKLSFQGPLTEDSLDAILHIFSLRGYAEDVANRLAAESQPAQTSASQMLTATKDYFDKVNAYIERVRKYEAQSTGFRAKWDEQQARRLDELGTLNVDPLMIDYGANVANMLRGNATSIQTGNVAAGQVAASEANGGGYGGGYYGGYYGGYGYGYRNSRYGISNQSITGAQQRMAGFGSYREAIAAIDKLTGDTRRAMTEKYKVQF